MARSWILIALAFLFLTATAGGTAHIYLRADDALWLVSDTLETHYDEDGHEEIRNECKVAITKGRLILLAGSFLSTSRFLDEAAALPNADIQTSARAVTKLLLGNRMNMRDDPHATKNLLVNNAEIIQVTQGNYEARKVGVTADGRVRDQYVGLITKGTTHGFASVIESFGAAAEPEPALLSFRSRHPKEALLKLMNEETSLKPNEVGPPFTILKLYPDGTVSDDSEQKLCTIPKDAVHHPRPAARTK